VERLWKLTIKVTGFEAGSFTGVKLRECACRKQGPEAEVGPKSSPVPWNAVSRGRR
jgi:hypothetical protein